MPIDWISLLDAGNPLQLIVILIIALLVGGGANAAIQSFTASRRGVKGDALVKEQNGIDGLNKLSIQQAAALERQEKAITKLEERVDELEEKLNEVTEEHSKETEYNSMLKLQLIQNGLTPLARP